jgi:hypothetical protein
MNVTSVPKAFFPFKDHYKQTDKKDKPVKKIIKKDLSKSNIPKIKEDNLIGWA